MSDTIEVEEIKMTEREKQTICLQKNLAPIRTIAGWTAEDLGDLIGVTKQTISNLENEKSQMSLTQYIAIRTMLDYKIKENRETNKDDTLEKVVKMLLDDCTDITSEELMKRVQIVTGVSAIYSTGVNAGAIALLIGSLGGLGGLATGVGAALAVAPWIEAMVKKASKNKKGK
ncbi:hypothetical protein DSECCO2_478810 [anaerobic digester metagenome]